MNFKVEVFCDDSINCNTYLIYDDTSCIIIDPSNSVKVLQKYIDKRTVLGVFLTHGHYDHFKSLEKLLKIYNVNVFMHKNALEKLNNPEYSYAKAFGYNEKTTISIDQINYVKNNDSIVLGKFKIDCLYTPGHTNCSMTYVIDNEMFCGDFLFKGSIGRTDLYSGNMIKMMQSINEIKHIKNNYHLNPGHNNDSYLFDEVKNNPYLNRN